MNTLFGRLLIPAIVVALVLPPSYCCASAPEAVTDTPVRNGCCGGGHDQSLPSGDEDGSAPLKTKCNCSQDANVATRPLELSHDWVDAPLDAAADPLVANSCADGVRGDFLPFDSQIPIRIIQCVWRC